VRESRHFVGIIVVIDGTSDETLAYRDTDGLRRRQDAILGGSQLGWHQVGKAG